MKKIVAISGSPKYKRSVSSLLIREMESILGTTIYVFRAGQFGCKLDDIESLREIFLADALVLVFPLYVDSLPAPLIATLERLEWFRQEFGQTSDKKPIVYTVCNCGFYEPEHTFLALDIAKHFSDRAGLPWGCGIGIGCGGFLFAQTNLSQGSTVRVHDKLKTFCGMISDGVAGEANIFVAPDIQREFYQASGNEGWIRAAKKHGETIDLWAKPHVNGDAI